MTDGLDNFLYIYKAKVLRVIDGDTFDVDIDLGLRITINRRVRLLDVDTPEIRGRRATPEGKIAKKFVEEKIGKKEVILKTHIDKSDVYGRLLAEVYFLHAGEHKSLAEELIANNLVVE